jgi:uncharacterized damage-inducible protein DinB
LSVWHIASTVLRFVSASRFMALTLLQGRGWRVGMLPAMSLSNHLQIQARANRLANHRLHTAMTALTPADFHAPRISFFPSLATTLNHILVVDQYYVGALYAEPHLPKRFDDFLPAADLAEWAARQRLCDERLIDFCDRLDAVACNAVVQMDRGGGKVQRDLARHVLSHLFMHQTHHRGQVHAMLSGTSAKPPQLDEFLMPSDAQFRAADMAALGWSEAEVDGA